MSKNDSNFLLEHEPFLDDNSTKREFVVGLEKGDIIQFQYKGEKRIVFVMNPDWDGKLHAICLKYIPRREFLMVVNADPSLNETQLYEHYSGLRPLQRLDAYRTYKLADIKALYSIDYNSVLQDGESDETHVEQHPIVDALEG